MPIAATSAVESLSFPNGEDPRYAPAVRRFPSKKIIMPRPLPLIAALIVSAGALASCAKQHIVNTDVDDTSENRKVVRFCEEYRHAVEEKDVARLIAMADAKYEDDGGTIAGDDDIDFDGLKAYLTGKFNQSESIRYEIRYRRIYAVDQAQLNVEYTYSASYKQPVAKGSDWRHTVADNRLVLKRDGDSFKILSGM